MVEEKIDSTQEPRENKKEIRPKAEKVEILETVSKPETNPITKVQSPKIRRHSALSIKSLTDKRISTKKKAAINIDINNLPSNPFSTETIQKLWKITISNYHEKGDKLLASLMSSCNPIAKGNLLKLELPSKLMKADLEKNKQKILPSLREKLQNYKIDFEIHVNEEKVKQFAYTPQEKYAYLKDKNELISVLKAKFNLDF